MDNKYTAGIDKFINDNRENIIRDIARLVAINSVEGAAEWAEAGAGAGT